MVQLAVRNARTLAESEAALLEAAIVILRRDKRKETNGFVSESSLTTSLQYSTANPSLKHSLLSRYYLYLRFAVLLGLQFDT